MYRLYRKLWPVYASARVATLSIWKHGTERTLQFATETSWDFDKP